MKVSYLQRRERKCDNEVFRKTHPLRGIFKKIGAAPLWAAPVSKFEYGLLTIDDDDNING